MTEPEARQKSQIRRADCKNEPQGGIYMANVQNNTLLLESNKKYHSGDVSELLEKALKLNLMLELENDSSKQVAEQSIISPNPMNETLVFDDVNDYTILLNNEDDILVGNIKEREKNLRQYQEIGPNRDDAETISISAEHSKPTYVKKPQEHTVAIETPDDLEDLLPFTFEENRSNAFVNPLLSKYILIFHLTYLYILCR